VVDSMTSQSLLVFRCSELSFHAQAKSRGPKAAGKAHCETPVE